MLRSSLVLIALAAVSACAHRAAPPSTAPVSSAEAAPLPAAPEPSLAPEVAPAAAIIAAAADVVPDQGPPEQDGLDAQDAADAEEEEDDEEDGEAEDGEEHAVADPSDAASRLYQYTADLSDDELARRWKEAPESLGSISIGFTDEGRLVNARRFPESDEWIVVSPDKAWATDETIEYVAAAIKQVKAWYPDAPRLRVNQFSAREGGYLRPHKSHQSGRDVDLGFYYPTEEPVRVRERERHLDAEKSWALLKALALHTDVQFVLVDRRVQHVLYEHALKAGEDKDWLDSLFKRGRTSLVQHARRHRDHFHVRFYNGRAQELGRRVAPLLALRPEQNLRMHRVRRGDTLGGIAVKYGTTVAKLRKANGIRGHLLRVSQVLKVPLMGPCTRCPIPPPVVVPDRRVPPAPAASEQAATAAPGIDVAAAEVAEPVAPSLPEALPDPAPEAAEGAPAPATMVVSEGSGAVGPAASAAQP